MDCTFSLKQTALLYICRVLGGRKLLARKIGATTSQIGNWINRGDKVPYHYALLIVEEARGAVTLDQLCPDLHHVNKLVMKNKQSSVQIPISIIKYDEKKLFSGKLLDTRRGNLSLGILNQPILVDINHQLLAFPDRFQAHLQAKSNLVPVIIVDIDHYLCAEAQIDSIISLCTLSERVIAGEIIKERFEGRRGRPTKNKEKKDSLRNFKGRSLDLIAQLVGFGNRMTYAQVKRILIHGHDKLIQAMDKKQLSICLCLRISRLSLSQQSHLLQKDEKVIRASLQNISENKKKQQLAVPVEKKSLKVDIMY